MMSLQTKQEKTTEHEKHLEGAATICGIRLGFEENLDIHNDQTDMLGVNRGSDQTEPLMMQRDLLSSSFCTCSGQARIAQFPPASQPLENYAWDLQTEELVRVLRIPISRTGAVSGCGFLAEGANHNSGTVNTARFS